MQLATSFLVLFCGLFGTVTTTYYYHNALTTITSFLILLCGLLGTITAANNDHNTITDHVATSINDNPSYLCIFGVKSVSLALYTSDIPNGKFVQINESCDLLDTSKPVFFMTHGFLANSFNYHFSDFALLLLKKGYTVFALDWSDGSCYNDPAILNLLEYPAAVHNTREVGNHLASYIKTVIDKCHVPLKNITLMGHSLGAHISAFASKNLQKSNYGKIPLLIGTDPAAPLFMIRPCGDRFCVEDAERVVALHTSALGIQKSIADLDLWFNNGLSQPACGGWIVGGVNVNCSHNVAIVYLANTMLDDCVYIGVPTLERIVPVPSVLPSCSLDRSNCIAVDNRIFDSNYIATGDYCVSVTSKYPYGTKNNFKCQK